MDSQCNYEGPHRLNRGNLSTHPLAQIDALHIIDVSLKVQKPRVLKPKFTQSKIKKNQEHLGSEASISPDILSRAMKT